MRQKYCSSGGLHGKANRNEPKLRDTYYLIPNTRVLRNQKVFKDRRQNCTLEFRIKPQELRKISKFVQKEKDYYNRY